MNTVGLCSSYDLRNDRLGSLPDNYQREAIWPATGSDIDPWQALPAAVVSTPAWQFRAVKTVVLSSKPVAIRLYRGETHFFAENDNLSIYAIGETPQAACDDFAEQLIHFYKHYARLSANQVTGEASKLKKLYESLFTEVGSEGRSARH